MMTFCFRLIETLSLFLILTFSRHFEQMNPFPVFLSINSLICHDEKGKHRVKINHNMFVYFRTTYMKPYSAKPILLWPATKRCCWILYFFRLIFFCECLNFFHLAQICLLVSFSSSSSSSFFVVLLNLIYTYMSALSPRSQTQWTYSKVCCTLFNLFFG